MQVFENLHFYRLQRSCEGYVYRRVSVHRGGWYPSMICSRSPGGCVLSQHALQVVSQHALQQVSRGVCPGGCLLPGVPGLGECLLPGGGGCLVWGVCSQGGWYSQHALRPRERRLLLRMHSCFYSCSLY